MRLFVLLAAIAALAVAACPPSSDCEVLLTCGPADEATAATGGTTTSTTGGQAGAPTKPDGDPCQAATECTSGFCVDDVCCTSACDGACAFCDDTGGCQFHAAGTDPDGRCAPGSCDGAGTCATGAHVWSFGLGPGQANVLGMVVDNDGALLVAGEVLGQLDLGDGQLVTGQRPFVVKYDADGNFVWKRVIVGSGNVNNNRVWDVDVDAGGDVYAVGNFADSTISIGTNTHTNTSGNDLWLAKLNGDTGGVIWSNDYGLSGGSVWGGSLAVDDNGSVLIEGVYSEPLNLGGGMLTIGHEFFVAKYNTSGAFVWDYTAFGKIANSATAVAGGNLFLTGVIDGNTTFGNDPTPSNFSGPIYIAKLGGLAGTLAWSQVYGGQAAPWSSFPCCDVNLGANSAGNVVASGTFAGGLDFGGAPLDASNGSVFIASLDTNGGHRWSRNLNAIFGDAAIDESSNVGVIGTFVGTVNFGGGALMSAGGQDVFVAKYHADGTHLWSHAYGDSVDQGFHDLVAFGPDGSVYVAGRTEDGPIDFGGGNISEYLFVARLEP